MIWLYICCSCGWEISAENVEAWPGGSSWVCHGAENISQVIFLCQVSKPKELSLFKGLACYPSFLPVEGLCH